MTATATDNRLLAAYAALQQITTLTNAGDHTRAHAEMVAAYNAYKDVPLGLAKWDDLLAATKAKAQQQIAAQTIAPVGEIKVMHVTGTGAPSVVDVPGLTTPPAVAPAPAPKAGKKAKKAEKAAPAPVAAATVAGATVRIWHRVNEGTRILDTDLSMGKLCSGLFSHKKGKIKDLGGQTWGFQRDEKYWYLPGSNRGGAADMAQVNLAKRLLEESGLRVVLDIDDTGAVAPEEIVKPLSRAERNRIARAARVAGDSVAFRLVKGKGACGCGKGDLSVESATIVTGADSMPHEQCLKCAGLTVSPLNRARLDEDARLSDEWHVEESAPAPKAQPAPTPAPAPKPRATRRASAPAAPATAPVVAPAPTPDGYAVDVTIMPAALLFDLAMGGNVAARAEVERRMNGGAAPVAAPAPAPVAAPTPAPVAAPKAQPAPARKVTRAPREAVERVNIPADGPLIWRFDLMEGASRRHTRHELNTDLHQGIVLGMHKRGHESLAYKVDIDKVTGKGMIVVTVPDGYKRDAVVSAVGRIASGVRGVTSLRLA